MCGTCGCGHDNEPVKILKPGEETHTHSYQHAHPHTHDDAAHTHAHPHKYTHAHDGGKETHQHDHADEHHSHPHDHHHHHHDGEHMHDHSHDHSHAHGHDHSHSRQIAVEQDALQQNDRMAQRNRGYFEGKGLLVLNLVSSPGSGKTALLEKTIARLKGKTNIYVIEGDQQTLNDANRIKEAGAPVVQINTGNGCHLDADMVNKAVKRLEIKTDGILMIENVGNLVCPALFDLGEAQRVVIISVTEGDDKPLKYPTMFETSDVCVINKTDLLPYVDFDVKKTREYALRVNPRLKFFELSVKTEQGMDAWMEWLLKAWQIEE